MMFDLLDLIQEGNLGLIEVINRYDYRNGGNFLAYVIFGVRSKINQAIANQGYNVKVTVNTADKIKKMGILERKCLDQLNKKTTSEELAESLYVDEDTLNSLKSLAESPILWDTITDLETSEEEIKKVHDLFTSYALEKESLEDNFIWHGALFDELNKGIDTILNYNEKIVIRMYYGFPDPNNANLLFNERHTLEEIAKYLNLSSTRVWQISEKALAKLYKYAFRKLRDYSSINRRVKKDYANYAKRLSDFAKIFAIRKEEVLEIVSLLPKEEQDLMFFVMGDILLLSDEDCKKAYSICQKIANLLNKFWYASPAVCEDNKEQPKGAEISNLKEKLECSDAELKKLAIEFFGTTNMHTLFKYYGTLLNKSVDVTNISNEDSRKLVILYDALKAYIETQRMLDVKNPNQDNTRK